MIDIGAEEGTIPRVCITNSIQGALVALGQDLAGKELYIHEVILDGQQLVSNSEIISRGYVPDAKHTGETWSLDPVKLRLVFKIKVIEAVKPLVYKYKDGPKELKGELWTWKYEKMRIPTALLMKKGR